MENDFEKQLNTALNGDKEIPDIVRKSLDSAYGSIRTASKRKKKIGLKIASAAVFLFIMGVMATNESVRATVRTFFNFNDKGVEQALNKGFINESDSSASDNGVKIALNSYFADSNKIGLSFKLSFDDPQILKTENPSGSLLFTIKNGNGDYIEENTTKPLKGKNQYISSFDGKLSELDLAHGTAQYDLILESNKGSIPELKNATIEIEKVIFVSTKGNKDGSLPTPKGIDGKWNLKLSEKNSVAINPIEFKAKNNESKIQIISAKADPTSFNIVFSVDGIYEDENTFTGKNLKLVDPQGNEYFNTGYNIETKGNKSIVSTNIKVSSYANIDKFRLVIKSIGEVELTK